jgi:hypothetical protein
MVMNWSSIAVELGRLMEVVSRAPRPREPRAATAVARRLRVGASIAFLVLLGALPVGAEVHYPAPGFFAGGLTPQSSWDDILKKPGIQVEFPFVSFGSTFVPAPAVCLEGGMLRIADPRMDRGLRVAAPRVPEQAPSRQPASRYAAQREDPFAVGPAALPEPRGAGQPDEVRTPSVRYLVSVYRVVQTGNTPWRSFLFNKAWEVPSCATQ